MKEIELLKQSYPQIADIECLTSEGVMQEMVIILYTGEQFSIKFDQEKLKQTYGSWFMQFPTLFNQAMANIRASQAAAETAAPYSTVPSSDLFNMQRLIQDEIARRFRPLPVSPLPTEPPKAVQHSQEALMSMYTELKTIPIEEYNKAIHELPTAYAEIVAGEECHIYGAEHAVYPRRKMLQAEKGKYRALEAAPEPTKGQNPIRMPIKLEPVDQPGHIIIIDWQAGQRISL